MVVVGCLALSSCGETTFVDDSPGLSRPEPSLGWTKVDPIKVDLPTDVPIGSSPDPDLSGGPVLVNIWASWCTPCKKELPLLQSASAEGVVEVIGFSRNIKASDAEGALEQAGVTYPNWLDPEAKLPLELDGRVPINQIPTSVLIRDGKVVAVHIGEFKTRQDILDGLELQ